MFDETGGYINPELDGWARRWIHTKHVKFDHGTKIKRESSWMASNIWRPKWHQRRLVSLSTIQITASIWMLAVCTDPGMWIGRTRASWDCGHNGILHNLNKMWMGSVMELLWIAGGKNQHQILGALVIEPRRNWWITTATQMLQHVAKTQRIWPVTYFVSTWFYRNQRSVTT